MGPRELLRWQWEGYPRYHAARVNLMIHLSTVPFFWAGTVLVVMAAFQLSWPLLVAGLICMLVALVAQGKGHKLEAMPPAQFTSPWNFVARFCLEQWINLPRFILSGGWRKNLDAARGG